ncbi:MAG: pentapeptide repeat-containing protein, partial [Phycisphaerales bacterium]|nr:pentapeptide repeat-containing protein [Phycisphaerales bacterium]
SNANFAFSNLRWGTFTNSNLTAADFTHAYLGSASYVHANLAGANLTGATLTDAVVTGANFSRSTLTREQLYSTASYKNRNLRGINLEENTLSDWDLAGQDLSNADLDDAQLRNARMAGASLAGAQLRRATLSNASLRGATLTGADLSGAEMSGANLIGADFSNATLASANLTRADARGASGMNLSIAITSNLIRPDGHIEGLNLSAGEKLIAQAGVSIPVRVSGNFSIASTATLDIADNAVIIDYGDASPVAAVRERLVSGRGAAGGGGTWTGTGISSSTIGSVNGEQAELYSIAYADNTSLPLGPYAMFHGVPVDSTSILVALSRTGDANLDGVVSDDDVTIVGAAYAPGVPQPAWALGDFDYNGFVDDDDVTLLGAFYDPAAALISPSPQMDSVVAAVPEPSSLVLIAIACCAVAICALGRKKNRFRCS